MKAGNLAELLLQHRAPALSAAHFAEVLDTLLWSLDLESGAEIVQQRLAWLHGTDSYAGEVALHMESCPFKTQAEMHETLDKVTHRWPNLKLLCSKRRAEYDKVLS